MVKSVLIFVCLFAAIRAEIFDKSNLQIGDVQYSNLPDTYDFSEFRSGKEDIIPFDAIKHINFGPGKSTRGIHAVLNEYADEIFANLQQFIIHQGLDPTQMPDMHTGFNYTFIITYFGNLDLTRGWLDDISTLHRGGDVDVEYSTDINYLTVTIPIDFNDLQFTYDYSATIMGLGPSGGVEGKVTDIHVQVQIGFNTDTFVASLDLFDIVNTGHISVAFTGNVLIDWLMDLLSEVTTTILKPVILGIVEGIIKGGLESIVELINNLIDSILRPPTPSTTIAPELAVKMFNNIFNYQQEH